jgi:hypothetical protein
VGRRSFHDIGATAPLAGAALLLLLLVSCGDSPTRPGPIGQPPPPPPPPNQAPVVESITLGADRVEADAEITVTATVRDAETAADRLQLAWSAAAGTFTGTGASVRWRAPKGPATPADYTLTLTVTETYGTNQQHGVTSNSPAVRVPDSPQEVSDMGLRFLRAFADSSVPPDAAVRDFADSCDGKREELEDIEDNRRKYTITGSSFIPRGASLKSPTTAETRITCEFRSVIRNCRASDGPDCRVGATERVSGDCDLTAVYEQRRWWLCSSRFNNAVLLPSMRPFHGWR